MQSTSVSERFPPPIEIPQGIMIWCAVPCANTTQMKQGILIGETTLAALDTPVSKDQFILIEYELQELKKDAERVQMYLREVLKFTNIAIGWNP